MSLKEVFDILSSSECGLDNGVVESKLSKDGKNIIIEGKKDSIFKKFLSEFRDLMIIILIMASILSFIISIFNKEPFTDSIIILAIVILNAILGFIQELKADKAIDSLKKMQIDKVKVKRNNKIYVINSEDIVVGDILILESGDTVPADARIISETSLRVDESSLTGESIPVSKKNIVLDGDVSLESRINMIYSGTNIVYGKCVAIVCEIGMNTELGLIAKSINSEIKETTPLQKKINGISKFLSLIIAIIILIMFIIGILKGMDIFEVIMLSISLAVAAIPEGLPAVITITLSLGMNDLAQKKAIVRRMSSVETLGCTEIICSDKTGTITQNKMTVREVVYNNKISKVDELDKNNILFKIMILNNDVEKTNNNYIGDPTEIALYESLENILDINDVRNMNKRIGELPFDSDRKMMSTINVFDNKTYLYTKGSFDSLIDRCNYYYQDRNILKMSENKRQELKNIEIIESKKAYRVLAYAYKELNESFNINQDLENELIFVGMTAMIDPPRNGVKESIEICKKAHIKPVMITGDSLDTAISIAKEVGILDNENEAITGSKIDKMSEEELKDKVKDYSVYARVSPNNKLSIVNAWKRNKKIVAMTGDGVNDAPALKSANIGVGMGITGTEVSKNVSDIVLADDSFSTIVSAVKEGRRIFDNIRNVLVYLLTGNITEVLVVFIGMMFGIEIFLPIQLLYINLVTDGIPAIALAFEKAENNIMYRNIRKKDSSFFTPFLLAKIGFSSILKTIVILLIYITSFKLYNVNIANTMSFLTLISLEMIYAYSCRNLKTNILNKNLFANKTLNKSMIVLSMIQIILFITSLGNIFKIVKLNFIQVINCFTITVIIFVINELFKKIITKFFKD